MYGCILKIPNPPLPIPFHYDVDIIFCFIILYVIAKLYFNCLRTCCWSLCGYPLLENFLSHSMMMGCMEDDTIKYHK
jgi:hypothetical protein